MAEYLPNRREVLKAATLTAAASWLLSSCGTAPAAPQKPATVYLQTDLPPRTYERIGERLGDTIKRIGHIPLAFAQFDQSAATIRMPAMNPELKRLIGQTAGRTALSITIGKTSIEAEPWVSGIANPLRFSTSTEDVRKQIEDTFQRPTHVDIDCEDVMSAAGFAHLMHSVREKLPANRDLTLAVPAIGDVVQTFNTRLLGEAPQLYRVMAYDWHGPWSSKTGPVAGGQWDMATIAHWVNMTGDARKIAIGYPAYGYEYVGTHGPGQAFNARLVRSIPYTDIPPSAIRNNYRELTSETVINGNWTSCLSPDVIGRIATNMTNTYPTLDSPFFWAMDGLTPAHLTAVNARTV